MLGKFLEEARNRIVFCEEEIALRDMSADQMQHELRELRDACKRLESEKRQAMEELAKANQLIHQLQHSLLAFHQR